MALYSVETRKSPEEVIQKAVVYFGEEGLGLSVGTEDPCCVTFQGGGGHVSVTASEEGGRTTVELETREWDYHVKKFMAQV
ncbi:MAG: hypothetical protein PVH80_11705 [Anaerolineae bacterium]|jgi:hypothetical protein